MHFSLYYRILIRGGKTHPLIFIVGTNDFIEYLQNYQILIFIYYKFYFIIFIESGILGFGIRNSTHGLIRNPDND